MWIKCRNTSHKWHKNVLRDIHTHAHTHTQHAGWEIPLSLVRSQRWPKSQSLRRWLATTGEMDSTHIQMRALPQGSHGWIESWCGGRNSFPRRKERSAQGTQGHTRTGDNEIRVNEGLTKPRPDGLVQLLFESHTKTRHGVSVQKKTIIGGTR